MSRATIARARRQTAHALELVRRLELETLPHQARYSCVALAHHQLQRALHFLTSPDADDRRAPVGDPWVTRGCENLVTSDVDRPMGDPQQKAGRSPAGTDGRPYGGR
jgi:hypothetical protein